MPWSCAPSELVSEPRALVPRALPGAARSLSGSAAACGAATRSTAARPRISMTSHASGGVARRDDLAVLDHGVFAIQVPGSNSALPGRTTRRAATATKLTRLQSSPAKLTSTLKRLNARGFPPGILLQLRVAVGRDPGTPWAPDDAVHGSCRRAAGRC